MNRRQWIKLTHLDKNIAKLLSQEKVTKRKKETTLNFELRKIHSKHKFKFHDITPVLAFQLVAIVDQPVMAMTDSEKWRMTDSAMLSLWLLASFHSEWRFYIKKSLSSWWFFVLARWAVSASELKQVAGFQAGELSELNRTLTAENFELRIMIQQLWGKKLQVIFKISLFKLVAFSSGNLLGFVLMVR